jgi:hypothetical protein
MRNYVNSVANIVGVAQSVEDMEPKLKCDMHKECQGQVSHVDDSGFIYCARHGLTRRGSGRRCRKLRASELKTLQAGKPIGSY